MPSDPRPVADEHGGSGRASGPAEVPPSASEHPDTWKFDFPIYHPVDLAAWRTWLSVHGERARGVWVATWRSATGRPTVPYPDLVEEAICWGWIDSTVNTFDDTRGLQLMTPRRPQSSWTRLNRQRVADMEAQGRMTDAGRRSIQVAQDNGYWMLYDSVEDLIEPPELSAALDASPAARAAWDGFSPSSRKQMLWWVISAKKPETQAARVAKIVTEAEAGRKAQG